MGVSGIGMGNYQAQDGERLAQTLREQRASQPSLSEMMKDAREQAEQREKMFQIPKDSRRYGDAPVMAYAKLARARSVGEVDAASGYARRQMAQLRAAKRSDPENADRIQAAIDQLQKAGYDVGVVWQDGRDFGGPCHVRLNLALPLSRVEEAFSRLEKYVFCE